MLSKVNTNYQLLPTNLISSVKNMPNNLELLRGELGLTNRDFSKKIGLPQESTYTKLKNETLSIGEKTINRIAKAFPEYNVEWILYDKGPKMKPLPKSTQIDEPKGNMYYVPIKAKGGFLMGLNERVFLNSLERFHFPGVVGECWCFEIEGYSMFPKYKHGDLVVTTVVEGVQWLQKGKDYLFQTDDDILLKTYKGIQDEKVQLEAINPDCNPVAPIPVADVRRCYHIEGRYLKS